MHKDLELILKGKLLRHDMNTGKLFMVVLQFVEITYFLDL